MPVSASLMLMLLLLAAAVTMVSPAKVLLVPVNVNSHVIVFGRLATGLAEHGHVTSILVSSNVNVPDWLHEKVEVLTYKVAEPIPYASSERCNELMVKIAAGQSFWEKLPMMKELGDGFAHHWNRDCEQAFGEPGLLERLSKSGYDLVIMDLSALYCMYNLPYKLGIPYAHFAVPFSPWLFRVPHLPSFMPSQGSDNSDQMTFFERLGNAMIETVVAVLLNETTHYTEKLVPEKPAMTASQFITSGSLFFMLRDISASFPSPTMPNTIEIGDIVVQPPKPLEKELSRFMDTSKEGVILVSFGSFFDYMPASIADKFCDAFAKLKQQVIWKMKKAPSCKVPANVKIMGWIPQNDLLAHSNLEAFVTHGGINSILEAISHQVPMVVIPIALDQPSNAVVVETKGMGLRMILSSFTSEELVTNINHVVDNEEIAANMKLRSAILRGKPEIAAERASFWVDHVVRYGADHLRTGAMELTAAQFFMLDIFVFVLVVMIVVLSVVILCLCATCRCLKRWYCGKQQKQKQS